MYDKVIFTKALGASLGILLLVAAVGVYGGVAYAVPVSGVGTYEVAADDINASEVTVHPQVDDNGETVAVIELRQTQIEGLTITKEVNGQEVIISADNTVESEAMLIRANSLEADGSDLQGVTIDGNPDADAPMTVATGTEIEDGETVDFGEADDDDLYLESFNIETQYLVTNEISIPDLSLDIQSADGGDDENEG